MSVSTIPMDVRYRLWGKAAGRCQYRGCNIPLWIDGLTKAEFNSAYLAHIIADKPDGPRGDVILSPLLNKDISNIMLLCDVHHRLIDKKDVDGHPVELLQDMKREHERRIELITEMDIDRATYVVLFGTSEGFDFNAYLNRVRDRIIELPIGQLIIERGKIPVGQIGFGISDYEGIKIGYVDLFYLIPDYRGKGFGKDLMRYADRFFKGINVSEYHLRVSSSNQIAVNLYTFSGMIKIEEEYPENENYPVWRMKKVL